MFLSISELEAGIDRIKSSPKDIGVVEKIVCRPGMGERQELSTAQLDVQVGLIGDAIIEVTAEPHLGCSKFIARFGRDAALFVKSETGKSLNMRGINARVIQSGKVDRGSMISKIED